MTDDQPQPKKNWFLRHKILSGIGAIIVVIIVAAAVTGGDKGDKTAANSPATTSTNSARPADNGPSTTNQNPSTVPGVVGMRADNAKKLLKDAGFEVEWSENVLVASNWMVDAQDPESQSKAASGSTIMLTVSKPESTPANKPKTSIDAAAMEAAFKANLGGDPITSMCDAAYTHWACFYDGVEAGPTYLRVKLTTDGGRTDADAMAKSAGSHWFNFIGCEYPELDTIVVTINGIDHNVYRKDTNADSIKCK